jgi:hypothetical protein
MIDFTTGTDLIDTGSVISNPINSSGEKSFFQLNISQRILRNKELPDEAFSK